MKIEGPEGRVFVEDFPESEVAQAELSITVFGSPGLVKAVKELIQRGANLWPDAPVEVKALADLVTMGGMMQDYPTVKGTRYVDQVQSGE